MDEYRISFICFTSSKMKRESSLPCNPRQLPPATPVIPVAPVTPVNTYRIPIKSLYKPHRILNILRKSCGTPVKSLQNIMVLSFSTELFFKMVFRLKSKCLLEGFSTELELFVAQGRGCRDWRMYIVCLKVRTQVYDDVRE